MDDPDKKISVLCLGPKGSGKTTLLKKLQNAEGIDYTYSPVPTIGTNIYDISYLNKHGKKQMLSVREVGGEMAPLWSNYLDGIEKMDKAKPRITPGKTSKGARMLVQLLELITGHPPVQFITCYCDVKIFLTPECISGSLAGHRFSDFVNTKAVAAQDVGKIIYVVDTSNLCQISAAAVLLYTLLAEPRLRATKFILVLSKMDAAYRQMRNEALLMLQHARLSKELKNAPRLLEAAPLTGEGIDELRAFLAEPVKPTRIVTI